MVGARVRVTSPQEGEVWEQCCGPGSLRQVIPGALLTRPLPASAENKVPSMIISLTDGTLEEAPFEMTKEEVSPDHRYQLCAPPVL